MCATTKEDVAINDALDRVNDIRRTELGRDPLAIEIIQATSTALNALRRYNIYKNSGKKSDLMYLEELIQTSIDSLKRFLRGLQRRKT